MKGIWWESGVRQTKKLLTALERTLQNFRRFNDCQRIEMAMQSQVEPSPMAQLMTKLSDAKASVKEEGTISADDLEKELGVKYE